MSHVHVAFKAAFTYDSDADEGKGSVEIRILKTDETFTIDAQDLLDFAANLVRLRRHSELDRQTWQDTLYGPVRKQSTPE